MRKAKKAAEVTFAPLAEAREVLAEAQAALEEAARTRQGPRAEHEAQGNLDRALPLAEKYQQERDHACLVLTAAEANADQAKAAVDDCTASLKELEHLDPEPPVSMERAVLLSLPLGKLVADLAEDAQSEKPRRREELETVAAIVYQWAGALGVLTSVEDNAQDLAAEMIREELVTNPLTMPGISRPYSQ